jgi:TrmH family RNA methyltransferase
LNQALAIILGSEEKGLSEFWKKNSDISVKIPMRGGADSLNVSATAAIVIYETIRQRS